MKKIQTPGTNPQEETTTPKQEVVIENAWAAIGQSLSEVPPTTDQKINQLTDQVRNINNGLNELIELSKILIKWQIENWNMMATFVQSTNNNLNAINQSQKDNKQILDVLLKAEKDKIQIQNIIDKLQKISINKDRSSDLQKLYLLREDVLRTKNINFKDKDWDTLLTWAIRIWVTDIIEILLTSPDIYVENNFIRKVSDERIKAMLRNYISNKNKS